MMVWKCLTLQWCNQDSCNIQIDGKRGTLTERDRRKWTLNEVDPCDKDVWRSSVRSAMHAASQQPGGEPTDVDDAPAPAPGC